jgi:Fe-S oxidoreductase
VRTTGLPIPAPREVVGEWAQELQLPRQGDIYIFTGALYQLAPYIATLVSQLERGLPLGARLAKLAVKAAPLARLALRPDESERKDSQEALRAITEMLRRAGYSIAYRPDVDAYSGALLYDLGLDEELESHVKSLARKFREAGVRRIVVVDPHTALVMKKIVPELVEGFDVEVYTYLELLDKALEEGRFKLKGAREAGEVVVHDSCIYARELDVIEQPRRLLAAAGYQVVEPMRSRRLTFCCGGPVEALSPKLSKAIADERVRELAKKGRRVAVMCPICRLSLRRASKGRVEVTDIARLLLQALT